MKKVRIFLLVFFVTVAFKGFSQSTTPTDFFVGKWEFTVTGTPNGDTKLATDLVRKEGKLTGELSNAGDPTQPKIPITKIEEGADKMVIYFTAQGYDINLDLAKVDDNNLKGTMYNMFEAKGVRIKE